MSNDKEADMDRSPSPTYEIAKAHLLNHAGLFIEQSADESANDSLLQELLTSERDQQAPSLPELERLYTDILACLEAVNHHINGETPSETLKRADQLERTLVGAMWYILDDVWQYQRRWAAEGQFEVQIIDYLSIVLRRISWAWGAVLDGDCD